jgi:transcriptional regulator with XRE-family HTH domain
VTERNLPPEGVLFGQRLREIRQKKQMTQQELADIAHMSLTYISNMEHGMKVPSLTTIIRLAVALECRPTEFLRNLDRGDLLALIEK